MNEKDPTKSLDVAIEEAASEKEGPNRCDQAATSDDHDKALVLKALMVRQTLLANYPSCLQDAVLRVAPTSVSDRKMTATYRTHAYPRKSGTIGEKRGHPNEIGGVAAFPSPKRHPSDSAMFFAALSELRG